MSALDLTTNMLRSPLVRQVATGTLEGTRAIDGILTTAEEQKEGEGGLAGKVVSWINTINKWGNGMTGFMSSLLGGLGDWTWTTLMAQVQTGAMYIWNFNFNATDEELDAQFAQYQSIIGGLLGGTIGNAMGWLVCGAGSGLAVMKFNKLLGARILAEVGEEALDELVANVRVLCTQTLQTYWRWEMTQKFKAARRVIKEVFKDQNGLMAKMFKAIGGDPAKVKEWGNKGSQPWSFAMATEDWVESIDSNFWQNFAEEGIEEFFDSCSEAFYVVSMAADQYAMEQKLAKQQLLGQDEIVEILPNREDPDERIILSGPQELLTPTIVQTLGQYQMLRERSIGNFMGETIEGVANREFTTIMLRLVFSASNKKKVNPTTVTLYNVDRPKLDWLDIKQAMGGINGYMWGAWSVQAQMDDETTIRIWANTENEGLDRINALAKFVTGEILTVNSYHEMKEGKRKLYDTLFKTSRRQYPWEMLIINPVQILNEENGKATKKGIYKERSALIPLWTATRPDNWSEKLQELFATPGPDEL